VGEAQVQEAVVDVTAIRREWGTPLERRRTMIQNVSMIGTPRTRRATATLALPRMERSART